MNLKAKSKSLIDRFYFMSEVMTALGVEPYCPECKFGTWVRLPWRIPSDMK